MWYNLIYAAEEPLHIGGCLRYGDNAEDEWVALSLLFDLTRSYPNIIARAWDCDGEVNLAALCSTTRLTFSSPGQTQVLLIEAAELLPPWLEPETSENRVFIADGRLHIVPLPSSSRLVCPRLISYRLVLRIHAMTSGFRQQSSRRSPPCAKDSQRCAKLCSAGQAQPRTNPLAMSATPAPRRTFSWR